MLLVLLLRTFCMVARMRVKLVAMAKRTRLHKGAIKLVEQDCEWTTTNLWICWKVPRLV